MYMAKLDKTATQSLQAILATMGTASTLKMLPIALGYLISAKLPLPSSQANDPAGYFRNQHFAAVSDMISWVNEIVPLNTEQAMNACMAFYSYRIEASYPPLVPLIYSKETAVNSFFGLTRTFSNDILCVIAEDPPALASLAKNLNDLLECFGASRCDAQDAAAVSNQIAIAP